MSSPHPVLVALLRLPSKNRRKPGVLFFPLPYYLEDSQRKFATALVPFSFLSGGVYSFRFPFSLSPTPRRTSPPSQSVNHTSQWPLLWAPLFFQRHTGLAGPVRCFSFCLVRCRDSRAPPHSRTERNSVAGCRWPPARFDLFASSPFHSFFAGSSLSPSKSPLFFPNKAPKIQPFPSLPFNFFSYNPSFYNRLERGALPPCPCKDPSREATFRWGRLGGWLSSRFHFFLAFDNADMASPRYKIIPLCFMFAKPVPLAKKPSCIDLRVFKRNDPQTLHFSCLVPGSSLPTYLELFLRPGTACLLLQKPSRPFSVSAPQPFSVCFPTRCSLLKCPF